MISNPRIFLEDLFFEAITAADPAKIIEPYIPKVPKGRTIVIGVGKAAAKMAAAFENNFSGSLTGIVVCPYGHRTNCRKIKVLEASHPVPDENGLIASREIFSLVNNLTSDDLVVALICGGGSALLPAPPKGLTLKDEINLNNILLASGLPISIMNLIRKHVSNIKGGKLALACRPAKVLTLVLSDVPGDSLYQVASGPTLADDSDQERALYEIKSNNLHLPENIIMHLKSVASRCPKLEDFSKFGNETFMVGSAYQSLCAAKRKAEEKLIKAFILSDSIEGESKDIAHMHAAITNQIIRHGHPFEKPVVLLSGGETTVRLGETSGRGGRNTEFLLAFLLNVCSSSDIYALAADTDGIDGSETNAGAYCDKHTLKKLEKLNVNARDLLSKHNSFLAFEAAKTLFETGPTGTNVNDFRAILIC